MIGKSVMIKGQIFSKEDLYIDGEVEGSVELPESRLTVGPNGRIRAGVRAKDVTVLGTIHGNMEVGDKVDIRKDAHIVGDIKTARFAVEDGANFKGSIDMIKAEVKKPAPAPAAQPAPAPASVGATPVPTGVGANPSPNHPASVSGPQAAPLAASAMEPKR